uniref:Ferritin n=1 Tax=Salvator merianae TaxID=96440 RepID=A0A8D0BNV4_SALMN
MASQIRQNFHPECEAFLNQLVNLELYASYAYLSMSYHFDRDDVALACMAKFLKEQSQEKWEHAEKVLQYQNKRGGHIVLKDVKVRKPNVIAGFPSFSESWTLHCIWNTMRNLSAMLVELFIPFGSSLC